MTIDPTPEDLAAEAFDSAVEGYLLTAKDGTVIVLEPWNDRRIVAAQSMGCAILGKLSDAQAGDLGADRPYDGMARDVIPFFWVQTLKLKKQRTPEQQSDRGFWFVERTTYQPEAALEVATDWAEEVGISKVPSSQFSEAAQIMVAIVQGLKATEFKLLVDGGGKKKAGKAKRQL